MSREFQKLVFLGRNADEVLSEGPSCDKSKIWTVSSKIRRKSLSQWEVSDLCLISLFSCWFLCENKLIRRLHSETNAKGIEGKKGPRDWKIFEIQKFPK